MRVSRPIQNRLRACGRPSMPLMVAGLCLALAGPVSAARAAGTSLPDGVVLQVREHHGEVAATTSASLHADGRLLVERSARGSHEAWERRLPARDVATLLALAARGLGGFDPAEVRAAMRARERRRPAPAVLYSTSDPSTLEFDASFETQGADADVSRLVRARVRWTGLRHDARRHPQLQALQDLEALRRALAAHMRRPDPPPVAPAGTGGKP